MRASCRTAYRALVGDLRIRPMTEADVPAAEQITDEAFHGADLATRRAADPVPERRTATHREAWITRTRHLVATDPDGCWVAEDDQGVAGVAVSLRRESLWCLTAYAVVPGRQGGGIGRPLLAAALQHAAACSRWMLAASEDPRAVRIYRAAGFDLHPQMLLRGAVDRSAIPVVDKVREGTTADVDLMDSLDRATRGAGHGPDHEHLIATSRLLVCDATTGSGYAYLDDRGKVTLLAASNRRTATRLLWAGLADLPGEVTLGHLTAANQWALDVGLAAGLRLSTSGYLGVRGMKPPSPYIHHGALL
jgi:GNAT superfamily N-acetyltransferase